MSEAILLVSFYLSYLIYRSFIYPIELLKTGKIAIQEEDLTIKYIPTGVKEIDSIIEVYNEMIEQLRKEKTRTVEQSYFLENLINQSPIAMIILGYDQEIQMINKQAIKMFELEHLKGLRLDAINHPLAEALLKMSLNEEKTIKLSATELYKCQIKEIIHKGFARKFILIEDLTPEILAAEKEAYGKVIRMMAHEVNNSMGAVNSILSSINEFVFDEDSDPEMKASLEIAINRNQSLAKFTDNFAEIIRLPKPNIQSIDLHHLIEDILQLFKFQLKDSNIDVEINFAIIPMIVKADPIHMQQVLSNIIKNSIEAIGQNGMIKVESLTNPSRLIIRDNGSGIDPNIANELFTPFFSTKMNGQGIGLMLIREILIEHGFSFNLSTDNNTSITNFEILFK